MLNAGLTFQAYCEYDSTQGTCQRGADHFPWIGYANTNPGSLGGCFLAGNCANIFGGTTTACSGHACTTADFVNAANGANPPNYLWYTPSDCNNMHGQTSGCANACSSTDNNCFVTAGDTYLRGFLVGGAGSVTNPASGSLFASSMFRLGQRTLLMLWWDENDPGPIIFYDPETVRPGYSSPVTNLNHFYNLRMIEDN